MACGVRASVRASASKSYCQRALDPATQLRAKNSAIKAHQGARTGVRCIKAGPWRAPLVFEPMGKYVYVKVWLTSAAVIIARA